ncbi:hypothetical protein EBT16_01415 [bacterium]|nr:hypothetical protein [bacterium]
MLDAIEERKLSDMLKKRFMELCFSEDPFYETWGCYIRCFGGRRVETTSELEDEMLHDDIQILHDPSPFGGFIILSSSVAKKILVLGLP